MLNFQKQTKKYFPVLIVIAYWLVFIVFPYIIALQSKNIKLSFDLQGYIGFYLLLFAPILFIIPYKICSKQLNKTNKFIFLFFGLILPYAIIYLYVYYKISHIRFGF